MSVRLYGFDLKLSVQGRARLAERGMAAGSSDPHVALTAADIPGANLAAPFDKHSVNTNNPKYCHIRAAMKPSMKTGVYHAYLLLESDAEGLASILAATCECVAGYV